MVAPKGSGTSLRRNFLSGAGINASFAVFQDATGRAKERCIALGIAIGAGYLFPTTFENEVYSDLVGERGVLWARWPALWKPSTILCESTATAPAKPSTKPWKS